MCMGGGGGGRLNARDCSCFLSTSPQLAGLGAPQLGGAPPQGGMGGDIFGAPTTSAFGAPTTTAFGGGLDFFNVAPTTFYVAPKEVSSVVCLEW